MRFLQVVVLAVACIFQGCGGTVLQSPFNQSSSPSSTYERPAVADIQPETIRHIIEGAIEQLKVTTKYTQDYRVIPYPGGDLSAETGACTDVVIRAFRKAGVDLQREVHE